MDASTVIDERQFKAKVVYLIIAGKTEKALKLLSQHYHVSLPKLKVGMLKGHLKHQGCYVARTKTIHLSNSNCLHNPYIILHEFYHHLRTRCDEHKGTEKNADKFAKDYIAAFNNYYRALV